MDSFSGQSANGIASPGTYVQFFVEAAYPTGEVEGEGPGIAAAAANGGRRWDPTERGDAVTTVIGTPGPCQLDSVRSSPVVFGAVSSEGVYLVGKPTEDGQNEVATKMDTPRSYVIHQAKQQTHKTTAGRGVSGEENL